MPSRPVSRDHRATSSIRRRHRRRLAALASLAAPWFVVGAAWGQTPGQMPRVSPPPSFSHAPTTALENWEVADFLIRTGQPEQAAPYIKKFLDLNPDDATLLRVRDESGAGSILRLADSPATLPYSATVVDRVGKAAIRASTDPNRLARFVANLRLTPEEREYAVERLREAGPYAVPAILAPLSVPGIADEERVPYAEGLARLDRAAVPPLLATLDSPDVKLVGDATRALGRIGDPRAIPELTYLAARRNPESPVRALAEAAVAEITGVPFASQPETPPRVLAAEARRYHLHLVRFPAPEVILWTWDAAQNAPVAGPETARDAEGRLGLRAAREALALDPTDRTTQATLIALALDHDPVGSVPAALASGPAVLGQVLRTAIADGRSALATTAATLLGRIVDRDDLATGGRPDPLIEALSAPDRRVQLAAAEALVQLDPRRGFVGSSRVVPVLARFLGTQGTPHGLVVDGNPLRGAQTAGFLKALGYDTQVAPTAAEGFSIAASSADVELIITEPTLVNDPWTLTDLLGNLKADGRTSGIPVVIIGPLGDRTQIAQSLESFPGARFAVTPTETTLFGGRLAQIIRDLGVLPLTLEERTGFARRAASLMATIARRPGSPFGADLARATPALGTALNGSVAPAEAATVLGDIPGPTAQRLLADAVLDTSRDAAFRLVGTDALARSIRRYGRLVAPDQQRRLVELLTIEAEPNLRAALAGVIGALQPTPDASGTRLQTYRVSAP